MRRSRVLRFAFRAVYGGALALAVALGAMTAPAAAHHSYGATYDTSRELRLDG